MTCEEGKALEREFCESWDWMEAFYRDHRFPISEAALQFIAALRAAGYDLQLRAGQSMWTFMVSRSREHGLRRGQPFIAFDFVVQGGMTMQVSGATPVRLPTAGLTPGVDAALQHLAGQPVD